MQLKSSVPYVIRKGVKGFTPYGVLRLVEKIQEPSPPPPSSLFIGDDSLFKSILSTSEVYGEYGCGASTKWVLNNTDSNVLAVDTSKHWINAVINEIDGENVKRANIHHVDLGELEEWGRPKSYDHRELFVDYTNWIWGQPKKPDTVLIDGRFRVSAFLTSLKYANEGTKLIFDDYTNRPYYHIVEKFASREDVCGRQCLFIVPNASNIDYEAIDTEIINFRHVVD